MSEIRGNTVAILGFGREGRSALAYLQRQHPSIAVGIFDKAEIAADSIETSNTEISFHCGANYLNDLASYDTIIRSPGIPLALPELRAAAAANRHITSATNIFFNEAPGTTIAVTGTKGKSTTASLIADLLSAVRTEVQLVGNIGNPALDYLETATPETIFVVECSSYQLEDLRYAPDFSVLLNVVDEHLDYHGSFEKYLSAKTNLVRQQSSSQKIIYNPLWEHSRRMANESAATKITFGTHQGADCRTHFDGKYIALKNRESGDWMELCPADALSLRGPGNLENVLAAITVASEFPVSKDTITERVTKFVGLPHRLEFVGRYSDIEFYNDSLSTIPQATINALLGLGDKVKTLIVGGHNRGLDYTVLGEKLAQSSVEHLILFPTTGELIWQACKKFDGDLVAHQVTTMREAVEICYRVTKPGTICLLSPGSSSLNLFRDYRDRGEQFCQLIEQLAS